MLTVLQEITEQFVSAELGTLEIHMDQSAAKVRRILPLNYMNLTIDYQYFLRQFPYQRLSAQQTKTVQAENPA